ncbi:hypothetical protein [Actinoplanes sp. URMC 104]|uniref:hypothetical protein n=1 Tax=Actinoplanes sp. URMC 104 TaxID=3423409 RepID=UPI003F1A2BB0
MLVDVGDVARLQLLLAAAVTVLATPAAPVAAPAAESCVAASAASYRHTFDGNSGKATISAVRPLCGGQSQAFALIAYTAGAPTGNAGGFVYAKDSATITSSTRSVSLDVVVPPCYAQVDAILGAGLLHEVTDGANPYGPALLGAPGSRSSGRSAHYRGGATDCSPAPRVTFASACDGSFTATLENAASANVSAAFLVDGRLMRLAPGRSATVDGPAGGPFTIRDSSFTTYVGNWRPPATGCGTVPTQPVSAPATVATEPLADAPSSVPASVGAGTAATATATTDAPVAVHLTPSPTTQAGAASAGKPMSTGSVLAIIAGVLLIGGGIVLLVRVLKSLRDPA